MPLCTALLRTWAPLLGLSLLAGPALAQGTYKIGEIKMRELRSRAEKELGAKFDLRRFHDAVLSQGAVPLTVLEDQIDGWIAAEKAT